MAEDAQNDWVARVLGVALSRPAAKAPDGKSLLAVWQSAKDAVDDKLNELIVHVRAERDADLDQIADRGLIGITGGNSVKLMAALNDLSRAPADKRQAAMATVRGAAENYRRTVFAHPMIDLIENNPWDVKVELRSRLNAAIDTILLETA